ncbi:Uncharacterised protein [Streptococcus pneumoniae]|nr:Uncharacterised protein [Streptococcus pneumoniae]
MIKGYAALLIIDVQVGSFKEERMLYKGIEFFYLQARNEYINKVCIA